MASPAEDPEVKKLRLQKETALRVESTTLKSKQPFNDARLHESNYTKQQNGFIDHWYSQSQSTMNEDNLEPFDFALKIHFVDTKSEEFRIKYIAQNWADQEAAKLAVENEDVPAVLRANDDEEDAPAVLHAENGKGGHIAVSAEEDSDPDKASLFIPESKKKRPLSISSKDSGLSQSRGTNHVASRPSASKTTKTTHQTSAPSSTHAGPSGAPTGTLRSAQALSLYLPTTINWTAPAWLNEVRTHRVRCDGHVLSRVTALRTIVKEFESGTTSGRIVRPFSLAERLALLDRIRGELHTYEHLRVDAVIIVLSKVLNQQLFGLPRLFAGSRVYPDDIKADAQALAYRWRSSTFDPDIFRGILGTGNKSRFDPDYVRTSCDYWGYGTLVNGQWWPSRMALMRDGGHGATEGGIHGKKGEGAYSVVLSESTYADEDKRDEVWYCGTKAKAGVVLSDATLLLVSSWKKHDRSKLRRPVRVFRTAGLGSKSAYRPSIGIRFDGLYEVVGQEALTGKSAGMLRFRLLRLPGQADIRYQGSTKRPTDEEVTAYKKHMQLAKGIN